MKREDSAVIHLGVQVLNQVDSEEEINRPSQR